MIARTRRLFAAAALSTAAGLPAVGLIAADTVPTETMATETVATETVAAPSGPRGEVAAQPAASPAVTLPELRASFPWMR